MDCPQVYHDPNLVLTIFFMTYQISNGLECDSGWFGKDCRLKCHCGGKDTSCNSKGQCTSNQCDKRYFGPFCQYVDLAPLFSAISTPYYLIDHNETTCNNDSFATSVTIDFTREALMFWLRIQITETGTLSEFDIKVQTSNDSTPQSCLSQREFKVSKTVVDVICNVSFPVTSISVIGLSAPFICSVYISGGRNVAVKQQAYQSTTYKNNSAGNAVDDDPDPVFGNKHCSSTDQRSEAGKSPLWSVHLSNSPLIMWVRIINRAALQHRLRGFRMDIFDENNKLIKAYKDTESTDYDKYTILLNLQKPAKSLNITGRRNQYLTLCEVFVYGETVCKPNYYGLDCLERCSCNEYETCNFITGSCAKPCRYSYGYTCQEKCSEYCADRKCDPIIGECLICVDGFTGPMCTERCKNNTPCGVTCPKGCSRGLCDKITGKCFSCSTGHAGPKCDECPVGKYGDNCRSVCHKKCITETCNKVNGDCSKCKIGYYGTKCRSECPTKTYGDNCTNNCPETCLNRLCNHINGSCLQCIQGKYGPSCEDTAVEKSEGFHVAYLLLLFLLIPLCTLAKRSIRKTEKRSVSEVV